VGKVTQLTFQIWDSYLWNGQSFIFQIWYLLEVEIRCAGTR